MQADLMDRLGIADLLRPATGILSSPDKLGHK
jgi:hypothetical protein